MSVDWKEGGLVSLLVVTSVACGVVVDRKIVEAQPPAMEEACFTLEDPGVIHSQVLLDGVVIDGWIRTSTTHSYWQTSDGRWGIVLQGPRFPWHREQSDQVAEDSNNE